jgi:hypothetical protein
MPNPVIFRDPADRAFEWPEIDIDSPLNHAMEMIAGTAVQLPANVSREWFNKATAMLVIRVLETAAKEDRIADLFRGIEPNRADMEMTSRLLAELIDADNPRLQAKCMAFVLGMIAQSQTQIARDENVGKAAVSKRCITICKVLGLPPSRGMKSVRSREAYAKRQTGRRSRPLPQKWAFADLLTLVYARPALLLPNE